MYDNGIPTITRDDEVPRARRAFRRKPKRPNPNVVANVLTRRDGRGSDVRRCRVRRTQHGRNASGETRDNDFPARPANRSSYLTALLLLLGALRHCPERERCRDDEDATVYDAGSRAKSISNSNAPFGREAVLSPVAAVRISACIVLFFVEGSAAVRQYTFI